MRKRVRVSPETLNKEKFQVKLVELTAELIEGIAQLVREGCTSTDAATLMGLTASKHQQALRRGAQYIGDLEANTSPNPADEMYAVYCTEIRKAEAGFRVGVVKRSLTDNEFNPGWVRDVTILERKDPNNWGRRAPVPIADESQYQPDESFL